MTYYRLKAWKKVHGIGFATRVFEFGSKAAATAKRKELKAQGYETSEIEKFKV